MSKLFSLEGRVALVTGASRGLGWAIAELADEDWDRVIETNLTAAFRLARDAARHMAARGHGRIINTASILSLVARPGVASYVASKGGLAALTFSLARESAGDGVTANGIAPAYITTPMVTEQLTEVQRRKLLAEIPVGRFCEPEEVAHVVRFLVSPLAGFITGEIVDLNGGLHLD